MKNSQLKRKVNCWRKKIKIDNVINFFLSVSQSFAKFISTFLFVNENNLSCLKNSIMSGGEDNYR